MSVFSTIICCLNISENPDDVVQYVCDITRQNNAKLIVVHVSADNDAIMERAHESSGRYVSQLLEEGRKSDEEQFKAYAEKHFVGLDPLIVPASGTVEGQLLKAIDAYCADLVIVGSMSTKGLFGTLFNRSAERLIGKTRVPVLVVPNELSLECCPNF
ncbi:MAG: universal stress protein [Mailhella sp.]|nr:universal stress protein [Mailhella sp.]